MTDNLKLSWSDRFALIDHFKPDDAHVCAAFKVTHNELSTARSLRDAGTFVPTQGLDMSMYDTVFSVTPSADVQRANAPIASAGSISIVGASAEKMVAAKAATIANAPTTTSKAIARPAKVAVGTATFAKPETATKKVKEPQKRGRKGNRIVTALAAVPTTQMSAEEFSKQHNVSITVLRQSKRFLEALPAEQRAEIGKINVRQDKDSRTLMIWREPSAT
jgi:hypothetical protein